MKEKEVFLDAPNSAASKSSTRVPLSASHPIEVFEGAAPFGF